MAHHQHLHRRAKTHQREARDVFADPFAFANAIADAFVEPDPAPKASPKAQKVSIVYITASKTFSGAIAGWTTVGPPVQATPIQGSRATTQAQPAPQPSSQSSEQDQNAQDQQSTTPGPTTQEAPTTVATTTMVTSTSSSQFPSAVPLTGSRSSTASSTAAPTSVPSTSGTGMSSGAKVGVVLGLLCGLGAILIMVLLFLRRKRKQSEAYARAEDEKSGFADDGAAFAGGNRTSTRSTASAATAPRLSLRPVTAFSPNLSVQRKSAGNPLAMAMVGGAAANQGRNLTPPNSRGLNGNVQQNQANNPANPFGNHAETSDQLQPSSSSTASTVDSSAFPAPLSAGSPIVATGPAAAAAAAAAAAGGVVAGAVSTRQNAPKPLDLSKAASASQISLPVSDSGTDMTSTPVVATAVAAAAGGAALSPPGASPVHRVQLAFKPSMADELGLTAGQLVRLLHEYDDGWALCIRLDRSQQGVCPRTCLSKHPVKPRPNSPRGAPPPGMRAPPMGPQGPQGPQGQQRPASPAGSRNSPGPYAGPNGPHARPMTPQGQQGPQARPMTPQGLFAGQPLRPQSPSQQRPQSPAGMRSQSPGPRPRPQSPADSPRQQRPRAGSAGPASGPPRGPAPGPSKMNPNNGVINADRPPQRLPTILRSGSPTPAQSSAMPVRKPLPEHVVGHAM